MKTSSAPTSITNVYTEINTNQESLVKPIILRSTQRMQRYETQLPTNGILLIEDNQLMAINGWLSPQGVLYACRWRQHKSIMKSLQIMTEKAMEEKGFVKLSNMKWFVAPKYLARKLTEEQKKTIESWYTLNELSKESYKKLVELWSKES